MGPLLVAMHGPLYVSACCCRLTCPMIGTPAVSTAVPWQWRWPLGTPGCWIGRGMFVEEAGEALLSCFMGRVRKHPEISGYEAAYRLFITLERAGSMAAPTRGSIREELVMLIRDRVIALVHGDGKLPFPEI